MPDPVSNAEIEDVLSSIRRLVSEEPSSLKRRTPAAPGRLVLTPAQRVEAPEPEVEAEAEAEAEDTALDAADMTGDDYDLDETLVLGELSAAAEDEASDEVAELDAEPEPEPEQEPQPEPEDDTAQDDSAGDEARWTPSEVDVPDLSDLAASAPETAPETAPEAAAPARPAPKDPTVAPPSTLEERIKGLEAALMQSGGEWEPDGSESGDSDLTRPLRGSGDDLAATWRKEQEQPRAGRVLAFSDPDAEAEKLSRTAGSGTAANSPAPASGQPAAPEAPRAPQISAIRAAFASIGPTLVRPEARAVLRAESHHALGGGETPEAPTQDSASVPPMDVPAPEPEDVREEAAEAAMAFTRHTPEPMEEAEEAAAPDEAPEAPFVALDFDATPEEYEAPDPGAEEEDAGAKTAFVLPIPEEAAETEEPEADDAAAFEAPETAYVLTEPELEPEPEPEPEPEFAPELEAEPEPEATYETAHEPEAPEASAPAEEALEWEEWEPEEDEEAAEPAPQDAAYADAAPEYDADEAEAEGLNLYSDEAVLDEDALREMVSELVREELQGVLGERITRNVRRLVRREIERALALRDMT